MAETTIEWTATRLPDGRVLPGFSFNPWTGCTKVSPACDACYAEGWAKRSGAVKWGPGQSRRRTTADYWKQPAKWNAKAKALGVRLKVFGGSLCDVFDAEVEDAWRDDYHADIIERCPDLDWLLLTKRPKVAADYYRDRKVPPNVWLGTTVENQKMAALRIPELLKVPAKVRFLSVEPMLGPLDLTMVEHDVGMVSHIDCLSGRARICQPQAYEWSKPGSLVRLDWIICGGESGPKARPMHPDWPRGLRDQCKAAGTPFHFKQWGEWLPAVECDEGTKIVMEPDDGSDDGRFDGYPRRPVRRLGSGETMWRVGKKAAGRLLDGVEHNGMPEVAA